MTSLGYYPTLFSKTAICRDVTLFFPRNAVYSDEQKTFLSARFDIYKALAGEAMTLNSVEDGGKSLVSQLLSLSFKSVYIVYHSVPFMNGGYEIVYNMCRSIVEIDNLNRIIVHPPVVLFNDDVAAKHNASLNFKYEMKNVKRFVKIFRSKAFQKLYYTELPAPVFFG